MKLINYRNNKHKLSIQFSDENNSDLSLIFFLSFLLEKKLSS